MPCPLCDDTGWKPVDEPGVRRVVRCECWREQIGQQRLADSNIPKRYQHCSLANFTAYNESLERALESARRVPVHFAEAPSREQQGRGIFMEGPPGVGKTHLAVAVLKQVIVTLGVRGLFYDTRDLLRIIRSTYDPSIRTTELEILQPVMTADLLVLDDLGAEKTSEWVEETMNLIVNTRYNERRIPIFRMTRSRIPWSSGSATECGRDCTRCATSSRWMAPTIESCRSTAASTISSRCGRRAARRACHRHATAARRARNSANRPHATAAPISSGQEAGREARHRRSGDRVIG